MAILILLTLLAAPLEGSRLGVLEVSGMKLRLSMQIDKSETGFSGTLTSLDQSPKPIDLSLVKLTGTKVHIEIKLIGASFDGDLQETSAIAGVWKQGGAEWPITFAPGTQEAKKRPQEPKAPFPYAIEDVSFASAAPGVTLAGTLTLPKSKGPFVAVVLISGSGPQDRDEYILGHKPFLVLAHALTQKGFAVLRYDDRGIGKSTGDFRTATTSDFAEDARGAVAFLAARKDIDSKQIGLLGHSEGGVVAPMLARSAAFLVLLAPPAVSGENLILSQVRAQGKLAGDTDEVLGKRIALQKKVTLFAREKDNAKNQATLRKLLLEQGVEEKSVDATAKGLLDQARAPWLSFFMQYDPAPALSKVSVPTLGLFAEKDLQVQPSLNKGPFEAALKSAKVVVLPGLNHLFQTATTGAPAEYGQIEETMAPIALDAISAFVAQHTRSPQQ